MQEEFLVSFCAAFIFGTGYTLVRSLNGKQMHRGAKKGNAEMQYKLGLAYQTGKGMNAGKSYPMAYAWLGIAAAQGNKKAEKAHQKIALRMTKEQIDEGDKLTCEYSEAITKTHKEE